MMEVPETEGHQEDTAADSDHSLRAAVILIVDDEQEIRDMLRLILTYAGYQVREAENGPAAFERVQEGTPDLILLDVLMPGMDGFDVCRRLRAEEATADTPILILSARKDARSREEGLQAGATKYLTKPQTAEELLRHVAEAFDNTAQ